LEGPNGNSDMFQICSDGSLGLSGEDNLF